jgi:DNA-binding MarR family transcriptional regulator
MVNETDPDELRILVQRVARRIRANRAGTGVTDPQLGVLFTLDKQGDATPGRLAEHEGVTPPSMNRTLNGLEEAGWIARSPDPDDARKVIVSLTPSGTELIAETRRLRSAWFTQRLEELSTDERRRLDEVIPVLRRLAES